jgi:ATP-dependent RNA helicase DeaD
MSISFKDLGLSESHVQILESQQIFTPTPIQAQAIPNLMGGKNVLALASTGSGKTLAFGLPAMERIDASSRKTQVLVLCPTRELANQVSGEFKKFTRETDSLFTTPVYGGESMERQIRSLKSGSQVVVGTPGRIIDHLKRQTLQLGDLQFLVLDEADEMLSMGFEEDIRLILDYIPSKPQIALFSATMSKEIRSISKQYLGDFVSLEIEKTEANRPDIRQHALDVHPEDKAEVLLRLIKYHGFTRCMAFCNTKLGVDKLVQQLAEKGYMAEAIHGDMAQLQRTSVMKKFRNGQVPLLVATDVAARGIDVNDVEAVFNVDLPRDTEFYVHRIGRTGRAGKSGFSFALVMKSDQRQLKVIERFTGIPMEKLKIPSLQSIAYKHQADFIASLKEVASNPALQTWRSIVDQLESEGLDPRDVLAGMISRQMGPVPGTDDPLLDKMAREKQGRESRDRDGKSGGGYGDSRNRREGSGDRQGFSKRGRPPGSGHGPERRDTEKMVSLRFNVGRNIQVRPSDFVGAIASEANVSGKRLGYIGIEEKYTVVDVPAELAPQIIKAMSGNVVKGRKVRVERV